MVVVWYGRCVMEGQHKINNSDCIHFGYKYPYTHVIALYTQYFPELCEQNYR